MPTPKGEGVILDHIKNVEGIINETDWKCPYCRVKINQEA